MVVMQRGSSVFWETIERIWETVSASLKKKTSKNIANNYVKLTLTLSLIFQTGISDEIQIRDQVRSPQLAFKLCGRRESHIFV